MKRLIKLKKLTATITAVAAFAFMHGVFAYTCAIDGYTWSYDISCGNVTITGVSPKPKTGTIKIPSTIGNYNYPVKDIGKMAFHGFKCLKSVTIPDSVTNISLLAFGNCSALTNVMIPDSVTSINECAFVGCSKLMSLDVSANNSRYKSVNGLLLSKDGRNLIIGVNGDVTIPDSVTSIGDCAFSCFSGLTSVRIPNSVTNIGESAFAHCSSLTGVRIPNSVTIIGDRAFNGCSGLTSIKIPKTVAHIGTDAFSGCHGISGEKSLLNPSKASRQKNDGKKSAAYLIEAGEGEAKAQFDLGLCYYTGAEKISQDKKAAAKLFREAAEQGYAKAQFYLGVCYSNGEGVSQDKAEAVRWFRKAADQGYADTQFNIEAATNGVDLLGGSHLSRPSKTDTTSVSRPKSTNTFICRSNRNGLDYNYFDVGCGKYDGNNGFIYVEDPSGRINYFFEGHINIRPQAQFPDGYGGVRGAYYVSDAVLFGFPTSEARRLWTSAMHSVCQKMFEWINTAKKHKVGHVEKVLPESAFKDGYASASVELLPIGARQKELYYKAIRKSVDNEDFDKIARRIEFKCIIDSSDNMNFTIQLLFGCGGEFPFVLHSCYHKTVKDIQASVQQFLQKVDPSTLAWAWRSQVMRNSLFDDCIADNGVFRRLVVPKDDISAAKQSAAYSRQLYNDICLSSWDCANSSHEGGRICLVIKDTKGDLNYTLFLGENGVAQRQIFQHGTYYGRDFIYDRHLIVFPTGESRNLWYDIIKRSCGKMLEWVELASKKHVPLVVKPIYISGKSNFDKLVAYYSLITKGQGQDELLKKELRTHIDRLEYEHNGYPISLICNIKEGDSNYQKFKVWIDLQCGDKYQGTIFEASGTYKDIQKECIEFLCKIDPNALIEAWKSKYGRGDLFK